jgi:uncharacterized protein with HEPN domain
VKSDKASLQHILDMISRIESATGAGKEAFVDSRLHQDAVLRNLHTMTETTQRLSADLKAANPDVEWATLAAFRNVLVHDYLGIDIKLVWTVVTQDIPEFKVKITKILSKIE